MLADHAKAKIHFEAVYSEENRNEDQRALALLKTGVCQFQARQYAQCFKVFRQVIKDYPVSQHVNRAYYYIGLGHFKLGHYGRAIESLEKVGTVMSTNHFGQSKREIGKRLFIKVEDADLAVLAKDETVEATCKTTAGDQEIVQCLPLALTSGWCWVQCRPDSGSRNPTTACSKCRAVTKSTSSTATNTLRMENSINPSPQTIGCGERSRPGHGRRIYRSHRGGGGRETGQRRGD